MMQHFVLVVDHLNTEPSIELSSERSSCNRFDDDPESEKESVSESKSLLQCRICHDDDIDSSMEVPCSCSGSLKYAHRKCIQRWCNEKGNTKCEICLKQFEPSYTAPPPLFQYGGTPMNFRGNWEISRQVEDDSSVVRIRRVPSDNFAIPGPRAMVYYWSTALVLLILLVLRHTLPLIISGKAPFSISIFVVVLMRLLGILVPLYAIAYALYLLSHVNCCFRSRQRVPILPVAISQQESDDSYFTDDDDDEED